MEQIKLVTNRLYSFKDELINSLETCKGFKFSVAFITFGGLQQLVEVLYDLDNLGIKGEIITTNYMSTTEPKALSKLLSFKNIKVKIYDANKLKGFHTKGYIFNYETYNKIIVGSSNITTSALKSNQEWNVSYVNKEDSYYRSVIDEFDYLWNISENLTQDFIAKYEIEYKKNQATDLSKILKYLNDLLKEEKYQFNETNEIIEYLNEEVIRTAIEPNQMQIEALELLKDIRVKGEQRALIIAATGTGKTYLSAFDAINFNPKRLLFVVHNEKILNDALKTFKAVIPNKSMAILKSSDNSIHSDYIFATNIMINNFVKSGKIKEKDFDYIVIDEAHHATATTYENIIGFFKPAFMLGMTATPERTDGANIFEIFNFNIAMDLRLRDALEKNYIVPFHYFGINDITTDLSDYEHLNEQQLVEKLNVKVRTSLIIDNINKFSHDGEKTKCLGFCVNVEHAKFMSDEFNKLGYKAVYMSSLDSIEQREMMIKRLQDDNDELNYIFTVNIFNEGIDIPNVNLILMLRPTESPIIFTQQLGRGLRKFKDKKFLTVLDFIGNHNKTFLIPIALAGENYYDKDDLIVSTKNNFFDIPGETFITMDKISKERILNQLEKVNFNNLKYLKEQYLMVKNDYKNINQNFSFPMLDNFGSYGIDPIKFIQYKGSYFEFVKVMENKDKLNILESNQKFVNFIKFIDSLLPLVNPHEFVIIKELLNNNKLSKNDALKLIKKFQSNISLTEVEYAFDFLAGNYFNDNDESKYKNLFEVSGKDLMISNDYLEAINNDISKEFIHASLNYGFQRYEHEFNIKQHESKSLQLLGRYSLKDIAYIENYDKKRSGFANATGCFFFNNTFYLFVNLEKHDVRESINYKDEFISNTLFQWESPNATLQSSVVGFNLINHKSKNINIKLFIRKNKVEDGLLQKYTYFGLVDVVKYEGEKPIKFELKLRNRVPDEIYPRFIITRSNNEKAD